jgi:AraC-like DNA-binding protein
MSIEMILSFTIPFTTFDGKGSPHMILHIKNMVSNRCKIAVQSELETLGLPYQIVDLGEVEINNSITPEQCNCLNTALLKSGLELLHDRKTILAEKIKKLIIAMVRCADELPRVKNSEYLSEHLNYNYTYLANIFSEITGTTIEEYTICQKIERVKELLSYDELNLTQISYKMQYSSVAHLSYQFKRITGLTPSEFKKLAHKHRVPLEEVGIM